ncbi:MAG: hypothetical protein AAF628_16280, partial [Planctomycetota bacterium]
MGENLKSVVLERYGDAIRFNPLLLAFAEHWRFEPRPVAVARGNEKGRSKIGQFKPICDFDWSWPTKIDRELVDDVLALGFVGEAANVI